MGFQFSAEQINWVRLKEANARCGFSSLLINAYQFQALRRFCLYFALKLEGGRFFSLTLRKILKIYHNVNVGKYSYGPCLIPGAVPKGTIVGSYCSIGDEFSVFRRNHPVERLIQHPFFYNSNLGLLEKDTIESDEQNPLQIGNDVWIGARVLILPGCKKIGNGAIVGAGSVVTKNIGNFEIVVGNPAKKIRSRFSTEIGEIVSRSLWWDLPLENLLAGGDLTVCTVQEDLLNSFISEVGENPIAAHEEQFTE